MGFTGVSATPCPFQCCGHSTRDKVVLRDLVLLRVLVSVVLCLVLAMVSLLQSGRRSPENIFFWAYSRLNFSFEGPERPSLPWDSSWSHMCKRIPWVMAQPHWNNIFIITIITITELYKYQHLALLYKPEVLLGETSELKTALQCCASPCIKNKVEHHEQLVLLFHKQFPHIFSSFLLIMVRNCTVDQRSCIKSAVLWPEALP